jgi:phospholipid transport system substrate-binding protein
MAVSDEQIVQTRIVPASDHRLDYVMRQVGETWKVVDVLADGSISRVVVQRSKCARRSRMAGSRRFSNACKERRPKCRADRCTSLGRSF